MKKEKQEKLWNLYSITNRMGGKVDYTAVSQVKMAKYKEALGKASIIISLIITGEDEERCQRLINELDALSRWNFADRNGRISKDEKQINERIKQAMGGWTPMDD